VSDKWWLRDWTSPQRTLVGVIQNVHNSGGIIGTNPGDNDTNVLITPDEAHQDLLLNRFGGPNTAVPDESQIECEINVPSDGRDQYEAWVRSMIGLSVTAQGVYVDDTGERDKSELHPLDIVVAEVDAPQVPGNWIDVIETQHHVTLGTSLRLFRFAAASDDRAGLVLEGPPLAEFDRETVVPLPLPPNANPGLTPTAEFALLGSSNAGVFIRTDGAGTVSVAVTCQGRGFGGPGWVLGEVVTYWLDPARQLDVSPASLTFGPVAVGDIQSHTVTITNTGGGAVTLTVPPPPPPPPPLHVFPFSWEAVPTQALAPGAALTISVTYTGRKQGAADQTALSVESDAQGSPQRVTLTGSTSTVTPQ